MPIFIGPNYQKFQEAKDLLDLDVIKIVHTQKELVKSLEYFLLDKEKREHISSRSKAYVNSRMGATQMIFDYLVQRIDQK
jgi:3-deoxy-D-manno-octulosonic-acid transferase